MTEEEIALNPTAAHQLLLTLLNSKFALPWRLQNGSLCKCFLCSHHEAHHEAQEGVWCRTTPDGQHPVAQIVDQRVETAEGARGRTYLGPPHSEGGSMLAEGPILYFGSLEQVFLALDAELAEKGWILVP